MSIYTKLLPEDYFELEKQYIKHCKAPNAKAYTFYLDTLNNVIIGIGFNICGNPNWLTLLLLCKFGDLKPVNELNKYCINPVDYGTGKYNQFFNEYSQTTINNNTYQRKNSKNSTNKILQLILSHKKKYKVKANEKFSKMDELNHQVQHLINEYNKMEGVEKIQVKDFSFQLTLEEAEAIYHAGKLEYINMVNKYLLGSGSMFHASNIRNTKLFISLYSHIYHQGSLKHLKRIFYSGVEQSRFLIWHALRYELPSSNGLLTSLHNSVIFGLLEPNEEDTSKADIPATINDIFSYLNYPYENDTSISYLDNIKAKHYKIDSIASDDSRVCFSRDKSYKIIFDSLLKSDSFMGYFQENSSVRKMNFHQNILDFAPYHTILSIFTSFIAESFGEELKQKKGSEELFLLENIYVVDNLNKEKFRNLMKKKYLCLQEKCNVLILLNNKANILYDLVLLQGLCPQVHFTIAMYAGYTYAFDVDAVLLSQVNLMFYSVKEGKYIPHLLKATFKAEDYSENESQQEQNILLFSAEEDSKLSGRLSNNSNIFYITYISDENIKSEVKLFNMICNKYEGNIQIDMQNHEYDVSENQCNGDFKVNTNFKIDKNSLKEEDVNNKYYYMYVNDTGEVYKNRVNNCKVQFAYSPIDSISNQKILFSFDKRAFICKKDAHNKSLDNVLISMSERKQKERNSTFIINKGDLLCDYYTTIALVNAQEIYTCEDYFCHEYCFKVFSNVEIADKIYWGYATIPLNQLISLYSNTKTNTSSNNISSNKTEITYVKEDSSFCFTPNSIFKDQRKQLQDDNKVIVIVASFGKETKLVQDLNKENMYIIFPNKKRLINKVQLLEKHSSYYGRSYSYINKNGVIKYIHCKDENKALEGKPDDENIVPTYSFGIKLDKDQDISRDNLFNIKFLKWLKITVKLNINKAEKNREEEEFLKNTCKKIIEKYRYNPLDIKFNEFSSGNIVVEVNKEIISKITNNNYNDISSIINCKISNHENNKKNVNNGQIIYNTTANDPALNNNIYYYVLNPDEQNGAVILCPYIDTPTLEEGMYVQLGFDANDVANYMAKEIDYNVNSRKANEIREYTLSDDLLNMLSTMVNTVSDKLSDNKMLMDQHDQSKYYFFYLAVDTNSYWDHKWQLSALFPSMGLSRRFHHAYGEIDIPYDVWSNIHFGAIGRYCDFDELILLLASDGAQFIHNAKSLSFKGDPESDKHAINIGFSIYNEFVKNNKQVNANDMLDKIMNNPVFIYYFKTGEFKDE